jgi:hypothetical protein
MGTVTVTAAGFTTLPVAAPSQWPAGVAWPGAVSPNGSKVYTISDADWLRIITWTAASQPGIGASPAIGQIILAGFQVWVNGVVQAVTQFFTVPAVPGTPPTIT